MGPVEGVSDREQLIHNGMTELNCPVFIVPLGVSFACTGIWRALSLTWGAAWLLVPEKVDILDLGHWGD